MEMKIMVIAMMKKWMDSVVAREARDYISKVRESSL